MFKNLQKRFAPSRIGLLNPARIRALGALEEPQRFWFGLGAGIALTMVSAVAIPLFERHLGVHSPAMMFLCAVILAALWYGQRVGLATALFAFGAFNFYLVEPAYTFGVPDATSVLTLLVFVGAAVVIGNTAGRLHDEERRARDQVSIFRTLLAISRDMTQRRTMDESFEDLVRGARKLGAANAAVLSRVAGSALQKTPATVHLPPDVLDAIKSRPLRTSEAGAWRVSPIADAEGISAALAWQPAPRLSEDRDIALGLLADLGRVSIQNHLSAQQRIELNAHKAAEKLHTALLASMSHDFRTPLSTIMASASSLVTRRHRFSDATQSDLLISIQEEAERLNRFVSNILSMTRLEADALHIHAQLIDPLEALESAARRVAKQLEGRSLEQLAPAAVPTIYADHILLEQALTNVLENAIVHATPTVAIRIGCEYDDESVTLWVDDDGPGVPKQDLGRIFDKFHRRNRTGDSGHGTGLGLAISKGLVEAMGGQVWASSAGRGASGLRISFAFPRHAPEAAP